MGSDAVQDLAHLDIDAAWRDISEEFPGVVGQGEDRLLQWLAHLASVDVEGRHHFDVLGPEAAQHGVHEPEAILLVVAAVSSGVATGGVIVNPLHQRAGTVPDSRDGNSDPGHSLLT